MSNDEDDDRLMSPTERLGHHVIALLTAAAEHGDPTLIDLVRGTAVRVGQVIAAGLASDENEIGFRDGAP